MIVKELSSGERLIFTSAKINELAELEKIENSCWSNKQRAERSILLARLVANSNSAIIARSEKTGEALAFLTVVPVVMDQPIKFNNWAYYAKLAINRNYFNSLSTPNCLWRLSISSCPHAPRGTGSALVKALHLWVKEAYPSVKRTIGGIRVPNYHTYARQGISFEEYYEGLVKGIYHENTYKMMLNAGGKLIAFQEDYFDDPDSKNFALIVEFKV